MGLISRRDAGKLLIAGSAGLLAASQKGWSTTYINSVIRGVQVGAQSYSFRDLDLEGCIQGFKTVGLGECELQDLFFMPTEKVAEPKKWWLTAPMSYFHEVRTRFDNAGVRLYAFCTAFRRGMSDDEIEHGFKVARALGVKNITSSANVSVAPTVDKYAQQYKIMVGFHGHDDIADTDEFSTPETFARAMKGASQYIGINLDIGHFTAANGDSVAFIREHHAKIVTLHIKDRKRDHGANVPFGEGDAPIVPVLRLLRDNQWKIPANIEYEYGDAHMDTIAEVKKCFEYCKKALET